jgi:hypothetical protein
MSGYDIFAWIVLIILVASAIGVFLVFVLVLFGLLIPWVGAPRRARRWWCAIRSPSFRMSPAR